MVHSFFVQAFRIVVDNQYVISIHLMLYCYTSYEMTDQFL